MRKNSLRPLSLFATLVTIAAAGCAPTSDTPPPAAAPAVMQPVDEMLSQMAETEGISEDDAKAAAAVVGERLWGPDPNMKVKECTLADNTWNVFQWAESDSPSGGWGCRVFITKDGTLEKAEFVPGE